MKNTYVFKIFGVLVLCVLYSVNCRQYVGINCETPTAPEGKISILKTCKCK